LGYFLEFFLNFCLVKLVRLPGCALKFINLGGFMRNCLSILLGNQQDMILGVIVLYVLFIFCCCNKAVKSYIASQITRMQIG
jgi:hypothetical protein